MTRRATDRTAPSATWSIPGRPGREPRIDAIAQAVSRTIPGAAALVLAAVTGGLVVRFPAAAPVPLILVGTAAAASARPTARADAVRGASVGVLLLAVLNGIPGVDLSGQPVRGGVRFQDYAVGLLLVALVVWRGQDRAAPRRTAVSQWLTVWCVAFGGWWLVTLGRTLVSGGVPLVSGVQYGRDFLY